MKSRLPIARLVLGTMAGICFSLILAQPSRAGDPVGANPLQDLNPLDRDNSNPFSRTNSDGISSVFNLIHRVNLSGGLSAGDFSSEQNENLTDAVSQFRLKQRTRLQGQTQSQTSATPVAPVTTP